MGNTENKLMSKDVISPRFLSPQIHLHSHINFCNLEEYFIVKNGKYIFLQPCEGFAWGENNEKYCVYDLDKIRHPIHAKTYINKFGTDNFGAKKILSKICFLPVKSNCPKDPETNLPMKKCAVIRSQNEYGKMCRDWAQKQAYKGQINFLKEEWYRENKDSEDCKCINRNDNADYKNLQENFLGHDSSCWYEPCTNDGTYMILDEKRNCDIKVCQLIYNLQKNGSVTMDNVINNISCVLQNKPQVPKSKSNNPVQIPAVQPPADPKTFCLENKVYIYIGIICILILVGFTFL